MIKVFHYILLPTPVRKRKHTFNIYATFLPAAKPISLRPLSVLVVVILCVMNVREKSVL